MEADEKSGGMTLQNLSPRNCAHWRLIMSMKNKIPLCVGLLYIIFITQFISCSEHKAQSAIELGDLIVLFMLDNNEGLPDWDFRDDQKAVIIEWSPEGIDSDELPIWKRHGEVRILVNGKTFWILKSQKEEVKWGICLEGGGHHTGPKMRIAPPTICFGIGTSGSGFDWEDVFAKSQHKVESSLLCTKKIDGSNYSALYEVTAKGKKSVYVVYSHAAGSGGASASVEIWWKTPQEMDDTQKACARLKDY